LLAGTASWANTIDQRAGMLITECHDASWLSVIINVGIMSKIIIPLLKYFIKKN